MNMPRNILYKDHTVEIGDCYLTIFKYYFPLATSKTIMFTDIQRISLEDSNGAGQNWGLCTRYLNNWFPLDKTRKNKLKFIGIHIKGKKIIPSFSPQNADKVLQIIYQNFTEEGKRFVQYRLSQCGKQTQIAQQQLIERMEQQKNQQPNKFSQKIVQSSLNSPSKRKIIKAEKIQSIQL